MKQSTKRSDFSEKRRQQRRRTATDLLRKEIRQFESDESGTGQEKKEESRRRINCDNDNNNQLPMNDRSEDGKI